MSTEPERSAVKIANDRGWCGGAPYSSAIDTTGPAGRLARAPGPPQLVERLGGVFPLQRNVSCGHRHGGVAAGQLAHFRWAGRGRGVPPQQTRVALGTVVPPWYRMHRPMRPERSGPCTGRTPRTRADASTPPDHRFKSGRPDCRDKPLSGRLVARERSLSLEPGGHARRAQRVRDRHSDSERLTGSRCLTQKQAKASVDA